MSETQLRDEPTVQSNPRAFFDAHCKKPGGVILVQIMDTAGDIVISGIFTDYDKAQTWSSDFASDDSIESCFYMPQFIDYPEYGDSKATLH